MTTLASVAAPARPRLVTRPLLVRFVSVIGTATSFYLLLSAVPLYARSAGAGTGLAGLTTTALTLSSVAAYPVTPRLMARYGSRAVLAGGLLALGLPALALAAWDSVGLILAACVVRGAGFAALCVAGGALTVSLIPARRRGAGPFPRGWRGCWCGPPGGGQDCGQLPPDCAGFRPPSSAGHREKPAAADHRNDAGICPTSPYRHGWASMQYGLVRMVLE